MNLLRFSIRSSENNPAKYGNLHSQLSVTVDLIFSMADIQVDDDWAVSECEGDLGPAQYKIRERRRKSSVEPGVSQTRYVKPFSVYS